MTKINFLNTNSDYFCDGNDDRTSIFTAIKAIGPYNSYFSICFSVFCGDYWISARGYVWCKDYSQQGIAMPWPATKVTQLSKNEQQDNWELLEISYITYYKGVGDAGWSNGNVRVKIIWPQQSPSEGYIRSGYSGNLQGVKIDNNKFVLADNLGYREFLGINVMTFSENNHRDPVANFIIEDKRISHIVPFSSSSFMIVTSNNEQYVFNIGGDSIEWLQNEKNYSKGGGLANGNAVLITYDGEGQIFSADGQKIGDAFTALLGEIITFDTSGFFIIQKDENQILYQIYDDNGNTLTDIIRSINFSIDNVNIDYSCRIKSCGHLFVWSEEYDIYGQRFDIAGQEVALGLSIPNAESFFLNIICNSSIVDFVPYINDEEDNKEQLKIKFLTLPKYGNIYVLNALAAVNTSYNIYEIEYIIDIYECGSPCSDTFVYQVVDTTSLSSCPAPVFIDGSYLENSIQWCINSGYTIPSCNIDMCDDVTNESWCRDNYWIEETSCVLDYFSTKVKIDWCTSNEYELPRCGINDICTENEIISSVITKGLGNKIGSIVGMIAAEECGGVTVCSIEACPASTVCDLFDCSDEVIVKECSTALCNPDTICLDFNCREEVCNTDVCTPELVCEQFACDKVESNDINSCDEEDTISSIDIFKWIGTGVGIVSGVLVAGLTGYKIYQRAKSTKIQANDLVNKLLKLPSDVVVKTLLESDLITKVVTHEILNDIINDEFIEHFGLESAAIEIQEAE